MLWHCSETKVVANKIEKCNLADWNGLGVLADAWAGGISVDGDDSIAAYSTYQVKIFDNQVTECGQGRAAQNYAIRIANDPFVFPATDKCYVGGNQSSDADVHFQNDQNCTIIDMDSRTQPGVFSSAEKTAIQTSVTALEAYHPVTPTVYEGLNTNDTVTLQASDRFVLIKHHVEGLTVQLPSNAVNGQILCVKNYNTGDASQGGNYIITVVPAPSQTPNHVIDYKYSSLELKASTIASGLLSDTNETVRLLWYDSDSSWVALNDAY